MFYKVVSTSMKILNKQNVYNQAVNKAKNIINDQPTPVMAIDAIQSVLNEVKQTKDNLHGDQNLLMTRQTLKQH